jgi:hypothetical protein
MSFPSKETFNAAQAVGEGQLGLPGMALHTGVAEAGWKRGRTATASERGENLILSARMPQQAEREI